MSRIQENMSRWAEIAAILVKYGFRDVVRPLELGPAGRLLRSAGPSSVDPELPRAVRVRMALTEIGTTGIKLGQILSTRGDLVGEAVATELEQLQSDGPADPPERARQAVEQGLGLPLQVAFAHFEAEPIASASIAQVHAATAARRLGGGGQGADIPGVMARVRVDLAILADLAAPGRAHPRVRAPGAPALVVREFERSLRREMDFRSEAARTCCGSTGIFQPRPDDPRAAASSTRI